MRSSTSPSGFRKKCQPTSGGPQGSPLTNTASPVIISKVVKDTEAKFEGVEIRCIQDDADILGPPDLIFGPDGALNFLLSELAKCNLAPNKSKFKLYATSEDAAPKAACLSVFTYKLTSYMSLCLWAILQENYREEYGLQSPTEP